MKNICVYLGANYGIGKSLEKSVKTLGQEIAEQGYTLVYGGSSLGMMGLLASTAKKNGGKVIGIITKNLIDKEIPLSNLDELIVVESMQERKKLMQLKADSFIVMPGGLGTLEEAIETWNAVKIGEMDKPIAFFNKENYFDKFFDFMSMCAKNGFLKSEHLSIPIVSDDLMYILGSLNKNKHTEYYEDSFEALPV